jgi:hypothetical protein
MRIWCENRAGADQHVCKRPPTVRPRPITTTYLPLSSVLDRARRTQACGVAESVNI